MECKECSKDIPDGFTDCPWCGASYSLNPVAHPSSAPVSPVPVQLASARPNVALAWISSLLSLPLVVVAA